MSELPSRRRALFRMMRNSNRGKSVKYEEYAEVTAQERIASDVYSLWIRAEQIAEEAKPGQFLSLYTGDDSRMLPRPISICEIGRTAGLIRMVYRTVGKGTEEFSRLKAGGRIRVVGPLGNGFPLDRGGKKALLMGGGIGIPPMVQLARELSGEVQIVAGYRDELFLTEELEAVGTLCIATEDGSAGTKGNVLDVVREQGLTADVIYACGPRPMLRAVRDFAETEGIECWLSMEERMACGVGACLACVCRSVETDPHTRVHNKRVCKDGPVFLSTEVEL